jgi:hypothetical protein
MKSSAGIRSGIQELARQVAGIRMLDAGTNPSSGRRSANNPERKSWWRSRRASAS